MRLAVRQARCVRDDLTRALAELSEIDGRDLAAFFEKAEITCFGSDLDRSSRSPSFSLGLLVTGTPMFPRAYFIQHSSVGAVPQNHSAVPNHAGRLQWLSARVKNS